MPQTPLINKDVNKKIQELKKKINSVEKKLCHYKKEYEDDVTFVNKKFAEIKYKLEKSIFDQLLTSKKNEVEKTIAKFNEQLDKLSKFALSEIAWTRSKELELKITNPFMYIKLKRELDSILSRLVDLDKNMLRSKEEDYKGIIDEIDNKCKDFQDERKITLFNVVGKLIGLSVVALVGIYTLIAMDFIKVGRWTPITVCLIVILSALIVILAPIFSWFNLLFNVLRERKMLILILILFVFMAIIPSYFLYVENQRTQRITSCIAEVKLEENVSQEIKDMVDRDIARIREKSRASFLINVIMVVMVLFLIITLPYVKGGKNILVRNKLKEVEKRIFSV